MRCGCTIKVCSMCLNFKFTYGPLNFLIKRNKSKLRSHTPNINNIKVRMDVAETMQPIALETVQATQEKVRNTQAQVRCNLSETMKMQASIEIVQSSTK